MQNPTTAVINLHGISTNLNCSLVTVFSVLAISKITFNVKEIRKSWMTKIEKQQRDNNKP